MSTDDTKGVEIARGDEVTTYSWFFHDTEGKAHHAVATLSTEDSTGTVEVESTEFEVRIDVARSGDGLRFTSVLSAPQGDSRETSVTLNLPGLGLDTLAPGGEYAHLFDIVLERKYPYHEGPILELFDSMRELGTQPDTKELSLVAAASLFAADNLIELDWGPMRPNVLSADPPFLGDKTEPVSYFYDASAPDASAPDAGTPDAGTPDAGTPDAGTPDAGTPDAGTPDAGTPDAGTEDAGMDAGTCDPTPDLRTDNVDLGTLESTIYGVTIEGSFGHGSVTSNCRTGQTPSANAGGLISSSPDAPKSMLCDERFTKSFTIKGDVTVVLDNGLDTCTANDAINDDTMWLLHGSVEGYGQSYSLDVVKKESNLGCNGVTCATLHHHTIYCVYPASTAAPGVKGSDIQGVAPEGVGGTLHRIQDVSNMTTASDRTKCDQWMDNVSSME